MLCPRCTLRVIRQNKRPKLLIPHRRAFHTTPRNNRLGAFTYAQEWQTGTYHFNKQHTRTLPATTQTVDSLLTAYATQQKRRVEASNPLYNQITRTNIAAQRRQPDRVFISRSTAKDFGESVEISAFVYDGFEAAEREKEAKRMKRMGVKEGEGAKGGRRGPPGGRRRVGGAAGVMNRAGSSTMGARGGGGTGPGTRRVGGPGGFNRAPATRRVGGVVAGANRVPAPQSTGASSGGSVIRKVV